MSHTYSHNLLHCVFSTKERQNLIRKPEELWRYVAALAYAKKIHVLAGGWNGKSSSCSFAANNHPGNGDAGDSR